MKYLYLQRFFFSNIIVILLANFTFPQCKNVSTPDFKKISDMPKPAKLECKVDASIETNESKFYPNKNLLVKGKITSDCNQFISLTDNTNKIFFTLISKDENGKEIVGSFKSFIGYFSIIKSLKNKINSQNIFLSKGDSVEFEIPLQKIAWFNATASSIPENPNTSISIIPLGTYYLSLKTYPFRDSINSNNSFSESNEIKIGL